MAPAGSVFHREAARIEPAARDPGRFLCCDGGRAQRPPRHARQADARWSGYSYRRV